MTALGCMLAFGAFLLLVYLCETLDKGRER
jgi:hypothetical protein